MKIRVLTGVTATGTPHLGNYIGAIKPSIEMTHQTEVEAFFFIANYHALIKGRDPEKIHHSSLEIAATWLALGLNTEHVYFYRQSDIPEIMELTWILNCMTAKGLMNRAHAYKAAVQENIKQGLNDYDYGISMGLFSYPVLMAADILMFNADLVPVGKDQLQHIEMARDIAKRMNHHYNTDFILPEAMINQNASIINGLDGRKMSKSYNNYIPLFVQPKKLQKMIRKIKTNSLLPGEPKDYHNCTLFQIYASFATEIEVNEKKIEYQNGASWGDLKDRLFEFINQQLSKPRDDYYKLLNDPKFVENVLQSGAEKARSFARPFLEEIRSKIGIHRFS